MADAKRKDAEEFQEFRKRRSDRPDPAPTLPAVKARAAVKGTIVRNILVISTALVIVAFIVAYLMTR